MKINLEIDPADLGFTYDEDGELYPTSDLKDAVAAEIVRRFGVSKWDVEQTVNSEIRSITRQKVTAVIEEVLSGPITRTDGYGNQRGETTTVREMVMETVDKWMRLPKRDSYTRGETMGDTLEKIVDELLRKELKPTIDEAKKKLNERVLKIAVDGAAAALSKARVV